MDRAIRRCVLAGGAAALFTAQTAYSAPAPQEAPALDPLVSVSVLGTSQSRAAACSTGQCVVPATVAASAMATTAVQDYPPKSSKSIAWPLIIGLVGVIGLAVLILSGDDDGEGDLTPISP